MTDDCAVGETAEGAAAVALDPGEQLAFAGEADPYLLFRRVVRSGDCLRTVLFDCTEWPPRCTHLEEAILTASRSPGGRWMVVSRTLRSPMRWRVRVSGAPDGDRTGLLPEQERPEGISWAALLGERVVAMHGCRSYGLGAEATLPVPLIEERGKLIALGELPRAAGDYPTFGAVRLASGVPVLFWNGDGYTCETGRFRLAYTLEAEAPTHQWAAIPLAGGGFLYTSRGRLLRARMAQEPVECLPEVADIVRIAAGPAGRVLVTRAEGAHGEVGGLYGPEEGAWRPIRAETFGAESGSIRSLHWAGSCGRLVAATASGLLSAPFTPR